MKSVVVNSGARRAASSLSLKEVTQSCVRTQTNSYAQDVLSSSWIHQSDKSSHPHKETTNSAINSEGFYGENHFFPIIFLKMFNQSHFLLLVGIPELWNKLVRVLGKHKAIIKTKGLCSEL